MRIAIIGSGLAGLSAAALLAGDGHDLEVLERASEPRPVGAGLLLQPPGANILGRIGALAPIIETAARVTRLRSTTPAGRTLLAVDYADLGPGVYGLGLSRPTIWSALMASAMRWGARIRAAMPVIDVSTNGTMAEIILDDGTRSAYDLIVIASGSNTDLWRAPGHFSRPYQWGCLWATVSLPPEWPSDILQQRCDGTRLMIGVLPIGLDGGNKSAALYWSIRNDLVGNWRAAPIAAWRDAVLRAWPEAEPLVADLTHEAFGHAAYRDNWADPPHTGRLVVIGDAAHGTSPQLGQGTTQALRDALTLAQTLRRESQIDRALAAYWHERRRRTAYYRLASRLLTPLFQRDGRLLGLARDALSGSVGAIPYVRRQAVLTLAGAKTGLWTSDRPQVVGEP